MNHIEQPTLFDHRSRLEREFLEYDALHDEMWRLFRQFAFEAIRSGHSRFSADAILHRIRWFCTVEHGAGGFKVNDHFSAFYARKFVRCFPEHARFFELRARRERQPTA